MKQIHITRSSTGTVTFETVSIDNTETVFFTNEDATQPHWPSIASNQLGPAPSPNSSQCTIPAGTVGEYKYRCKIDGHGSESGVINVFARLAAGTTTLPQATKGNPIASAQVVVGGLSPYTITGQLFQVTDNSGKVIQSGSDSIGPGLQLNPSNNNSGITATGTPTLSGTYNFTFTVDDGAGRNLQQVQYSMKVV
jgi:hypothetical protein